MCEVDGGGGPGRRRLSPVLMLDGHGLGFGSMADGLWSWREDGEASPDSEKYKELTGPEAQWDAVRVTHTVT